MDANAAGTWLGVIVALGIAIVGWSNANTARRQADAANKHAAESNAIADEALALAKSAEDRADRLERIQLEKRDIAWAENRVKPNPLGTVSFTNIGTDTAHDVTLVIDTIGQSYPRQTQAFPSIAPAENIAINLTAIAAEINTRLTESTVRARNSGIAYVPTRSFKVRARVTWQSESGVPGIQEWDSVPVATA